MTLILARVKNGQYDFLVISYGLFRSGRMQAHDLREGVGNGVQNRGKYFLNRHDSVELGAGGGEGQLFGLPPP